MSNLKIISGLKFYFLSLAVSAIILSLTFCTEEQLTSVSNPDDTQQEMILDKTNLQVKKVMQTQNRHTESLMKHPDVVGTATGLTEDGRLAILVLTKDQLTFKRLLKSGKKIPKELDDVPVVLYFAGEIRALKPDKPGKPGKPGNEDPVDTDHKALQTPPISLGTSGGWAYDLANGYCCGGTLGALLSINGDLHILSAYHVLELDKVEGDNNRIAQSGDPVIQPALIDAGCNSANSQEIAYLVVNNALPQSNVDAAVAAIIPDMVKSDGSILEIGMVSSKTANASLGLKVKKSGRTTGLTRSVIEGLNATLSVIYEDECVGNEAFKKTFTGQILIQNRGSTFLAGGDSGSLMVEDRNKFPKSVGLLFAGSTSIAVANPIDEVLDFFGASMVGK